jgi:hypothetical protein
VLSNPASHMIHLRPTTKHLSFQTGSRAAWTLGIAALLCCLLWSVAGECRVAKQKAKARLPDLKIVSVDPAPVPYLVPGEGPLMLTIMVELPKTIPGETLLDVTTLITSPTRSSIRLLSTRQFVPEKTATDADARIGETPRIEIIQTWDGTDQTKRVVPDGRYDYLVQAKLMVNGKNGAVTRMTSWRKRGIIEVQTR